MPLWFIKMILKGADISFTLGMTVADIGFVTHSYSGKVQGDEIIGAVKLQRTIKEETFTEEQPWRARRAAISSYFAPTGLGFANPANVK